MADHPASQPGAHVSARWAAWRAATDLHEYETRWDRLEADGAAPHGEADLACRYRPGRVLDAGCGMGRVAIELHRRGIDVVGVDLDDDLLAVARRHAPNVTWLHSDLAGDQFGDPYDLIVMAGNVMIFCDPADRERIVTNLAGHLDPGGRLIAGFAVEATPGALTLAEYLHACRAGGLEVESVAADWNGDRSIEVDHDDAGYAVVIARRPIP